MLKIRRVIDRERRRTKGKKRSSETEDHEKQRLATLKRLKRDDENELERKLRLKKTVATKIAQVVHGDGRRKKRKNGEDGSYQTPQVGRGDGRRKKSKTGE